MIRIGEKTILLLFPDGRSMPFDPAVLQERLAAALADYVDPKDRAVARDLASAVEMALLSLSLAPIQPSEVSKVYILPVSNLSGFITTS